MDYRQTTEAKVSRWFGFTAVLVLIAVSSMVAVAATPPAGTVSQTSPTVTWTGPLLTPTASSTCNGPNDPSCDNFKLTIVPPDSTFGPYQVSIQTVSALSGDWDMQVYDPSGKVVGSSGNGSGTPSNPEVESVTLTNPVAGTYTVAMAPFSPMVGTDGTSYHGSATLQHVSATGTSGNGTEPLSYAIYPAPPPLGQHAGEPSCGSDWKTKKILFEASGTATLPITTDLQTLRVTFNDCTSPATATWEDVTFGTESLQSLDAILFTDHFTNRTFVSQLTGQDSIAAFTDNDGSSWTPSQGGGIPSGVDHETVGGGPYHAPLTGGTPAYPDAVYYCSQDIATAFCARSDDGGLTYGAGVPTWTTQTCGGIHGHVKVSPADGTVYVPNKNCQTKQGVAVSQDNGITWTVNLVPGTTNGDWDPSVGIATDGTVYFGDNDGSGRPLISVSHDHGTSWTTPTDVGAFVLPQQATDTAGVKSVAFPAVVAGDPMRAAFVFLGSTFGPGGGGDDPNWGGVWHLYSSHTYDDGATWTTLDVTRNDPVQRHATICSFGINCANGTRNLLDFNDATIDQDGRVVIAYADGCVGQCASGGPNSFSAVGTIARQVNGRRMFAVDDVVGVPSAPLVSAQFDCTNPSIVHISWSTPDSHGSPITAYNIYRSTNGGSFALIQSVGPTVNEFDDSVAAGTAVKYEVKAVNASGEGPACSGVVPAPCPPPPPVENPCVIPGITVLTDAVGDATDKQPGHDIVKLSIAEPASLGPGKLMFILKMVSLQDVPPDTTWPILFHAPAGDFWVRMSNVPTASNPTGAIKFAYGSGTSYTALNPTDNPGTPADSASGFNADGTISIIIPRSVIGNPAPGSQLTQFLVRISLEGAALSGTPDNMPDSLARSGTYSVKGSENCVASCAAPTANPDSATTTENQPVEINVVANDKDGGSPPLTVTGVTKPANGTATNNGNGTVTYKPNSSFTGTDNFQYTIQNGCGATATGTVTVTVNAPPPPQCFEDDDPHFAYDNGWHTVSDPNASAGHYHLKDGKADPHGMSFTFQLQSGQGSLQYFYATSTKGGSASVYIDGVSFGTVSYQGGPGSMHNPTFGISSTYTVLNQGTHTFELRDINGAAYVDKICVSNSTASGAQATSGPGTTAISINPLAVGQQLLQAVTVPVNALGFSVLAEGDSNAPYTLVVIDPAGSVLGTVNSSNGIAEVEGMVSTTGSYVIKLVNTGTGTLNVWTASTPFVQR
jgi:hypothetical protein